MRALRATYDVLVDLIIGDDWRVAVGIVLTLAVTALLAHHGVPMWWAPPLAVVGLLAATVFGARRAAKAPENGS